MKRKAVSGIMLILLLTSMLTLAFNIQPIKAWTGTVYIRADGSIDPPDAPMITYDYVTYTLTDNISSSAHGIVVERDNIVVDGAGYTVQGTGAMGWAGIYLKSRSNVTIKNTRITTFYLGVYLYTSSRNSISGNNITNNSQGISIDSSNYNSIGGNELANNDKGVSLGGSSNNNISSNTIMNNTVGVYLTWYENHDNRFWHNNFIDNTQQVYNMYAVPVSIWDDGYPSGGNYWSDYTNGDEFSGPFQNETGSDGIGDTPYVIDENNQDRYPLMKPFGAPRPIPPWIGTVYILADGSIYPPDAPISTVDNVTYTLTGNITSNTDGIVVERDNIIIDGEGYTLQGSGAGVYPYKGIHLSWRTNVTIRNIQIKNFYHGIRLDSSSNNTISENKITNNTRGILLYYSSGNSISGNNITANNEYSIGLGLSHNNTIIGNNITNNSGGIWVDSSSNNTISGNKITNNTRGIRLSESSNNSISENMFFNDGLSVWDSYGNIVVDNLVNGKPLVYLEGVSDYTIEDAGQVILVNSKNIVVENLNLSYTAVSVELLRTNYTKIIGNNITNNSIGVRLQESSNNIVSGNNIAANQGSGISMYYSSNNNSIVGNHIVNNSYGIFLSRSSKNIIYHNNFVHSKWAQTYTFVAPNNVWDDGYPSGGNYWSDYTNGDEFSGPFQNETGSDGIGDTPYVIDENNRDLYPLMYQWPDTIPPTTIDDYDGLWRNTDFTITLTATDDESGVKETYYKINDGPTKTVSADGQPVITIESANNTLEYWSVDNAGNEELPHNFLTRIKLDKTAPAGSMLINNGDSYTNSTSVTLTLTAEDETAGVAQMRFSDDGIDWSSWESYITSKVWILPSNDGTRTVYVQFMDNAGLISQSYQDTIILDTTLPVADAGTDQTVAEDTLVTLDASASADENGIASYTWTFTDVTPQTLTGKNPTYNFTTPGTYIVILTVTDPAGNTNTDTVTITVLLDTDKDQTPDVTDPDDDNDGVNDDEDAFPLDPTESIDTDEDWIGNNADTDDDNDGVLDANDAFPLDSTESTDTDGDGVGNNADPDDDNDEMPDSWETENGLNPLDPADASLDPDGDGLTNLQEYQQGTNPNVSDAEAFPMWIIGAAVATIAIAAAAIAVFWRRRKQPLTKR